MNDKLSPLDSALTQAVEIPSQTKENPYYTQNRLSPGDLESYTGEDSLSGDAPAYQAVKEEKPVHRLAIMMAVAGADNKTIALALDKSTQWVSITLRQPWARKRITDELAKSGRDIVTDLIRGAAVDSFYTLIEVRDNPETPPAVKATVANSLLDRHLGKAVIKTENMNVNQNVPNSLEEVNRAIENLKEQETALVGTAKQREKN